LWINSKFYGILIKELLNYAPIIIEIFNI